MTEHESVLHGAYQGEPIRSSTNQTLKYARSLKRRDVRRRERAFVVEGGRAIQDAIDSGVNPSLLLVRSGDDHQTLLATIDQQRTLVRLVAPALFAQIAETVHPQGILGIFPLPELPMPKTSTPLFVVIDGFRDPGNLGSVLRSAAAAGASAAILAPDTVDPFNSKVVRAAMGAHFRLPLLDLDDEGVEAIVSGTTLRAIARVSAALSYDALDWREPATLIVASETGHGSSLGERLATCEVAIPMAAGVESLNAAVAGAVILFEAARQRRHGGTPKPSAIDGTVRY